jgi:hypothetical protein
MCEAETRSVCAETGKAAQPPQVMTARESNLASLQRWYGTYQGRGLDPARDLIDEIFDPQVEFSPWLAREVERRTYRGHEGLRPYGSHDEALGAAHEAQRA